MKSNSVTHFKVIKKDKKYKFTLHILEQTAEDKIIDVIKILFFLILIKALFIWKITSIRFVFTAIKHLLFTFFFQP